MTQASRLFLAVLVAALLPLSCLAAEIANPVTIQSVKAKVTIAGSGEIGGQLHGGKARIELLSFKETENQKILSLQETLSINGKAVEASREQDEYGNRYAVFEVRERGSISYEIEAEIETNQTLDGLQDFDLGRGIGGKGSYTEPTENVESGSERIRRIALNRFDSNSWLLTLRDVVDWTHGYITYDIAYYPENYSALQTLESKRGVCDEFAALAAAMLRAKQVPVRFAAGVVYSGDAWGNHSWIEAFNPKSGWVAADPTYGEATLVDGTHFYRGAFPDPAGASAKITVTSTKPQEATVELEEKNPAVEVENVEYFSGVVSIEAQDTALQANKWHDLNVLVKNELDSSLIAPVLLVLPEGFIAESREESALFQALEEKNISWRVRMNRELQPKEFLTGTYKIFSLSKEKEAGLKVFSGKPAAEEALLALKDLLPIVRGKDMVVQVTLENLGKEQAAAKLRVEDGRRIEKTIYVPAYSRKTDSIRVQGFSAAPYTVSISGPGLQYSTRVTAREGIAVEKRPGEQEQQGNLLGMLPGNPVEIALAAMIFAGTVVIVFLLKALLSK